MKNKGLLSRLCKAKVKRKGFTLVEVLISMLILAIALFAIAGMFVSTLVLQLSLKDRENAQLASLMVLQKLEALESIDALTVSSDVIEIEGKPYAVSWIVESEDSVGGKVFGKTLTFDVAWEGVRGEKRLSFVNTFSRSFGYTRGKRLGQEIKDGRPGYGYGDTLQDHTGPPGQNKK
jgi:prepilin-type N-terminal cleavage/methylation domain-containing protein